MRISFAHAAAMLMAVATIGPVHAQMRPYPDQNWAAQQRQQAFATNRLAKSTLRHDWVSIRLGDRTLRAFVTFPATKAKVPVVIVGHEVFGLTDSTRNTADEIAALGYITVTPDFASGFAPDGKGTSSFPVTRMVGETLTSLPDQTVNGSYDAWADYALHLPQSNGKLAIVGLSWSGGTAFRYAASPEHNRALKLVCVFYDVGPPTVTQGPNKAKPDNPPIPVTAIDVPVYGFYPSQDTRVIKSLPATKAAMASAGKTWDPVVYEGADHAFMRVGEDPNDKNPANPPAVKAALKRLATILAGM